MGGYLFIKILVVLIIIGARFAIKAARNSSSNQPFTPPQNPYQQQKNQPLNQFGLPQQPYSGQQQNPSTDPFGISQQNNQQPNQQFGNIGNAPQPNLYNESNYAHKQRITTSAEFYCMYCGKKFQSAQALKMDTCFRHPDTSILQKHVLYQGPGRPELKF